MWTCPKCERKFQHNNQRHYCTTTEIGELFLDKSDELVLAFDAVMQKVMEWKPNYAGASTKSVVFTNKKAWLIVKPMKKELDLKIYLEDKLDSPRLKKITAYPNKFAHHFRISSEYHVDQELMDILKLGYQYAMQ